MSYHAVIALLGGAPSPEAMGTQEKADFARYAEFSRATGHQLWCAAAEQQLTETDIVAAYEKLAGAWPQQRATSRRCRIGWHRWSWLSPRNSYLFHSAIRRCERCKLAQLVHLDPPGAGR